MSRTFAMGEANWQLWCRVRVCDQRGHIVYFQDQLGCPTLPTHQHRLRLSGSEQLEGADSSTWQGCHWWACAVRFKCQWLRCKTVSFCYLWCTFHCPLTPLPFLGFVSPAVFATCTYSSYLFVCFLHDVKNVLKMYRLSTGEELRTFPLDVGSVVGFTGRKRDSEIFYYFTSFLSPGTWFTKLLIFFINLWG